MNTPTVGQVRAAIEGLPDDARVHLAFEFADDAPDDGEVLVVLRGFRRDEESLWVEVLVDLIEIGEGPDGE